MINDDEINIIRQKVDIVDIISEYISVVQKGKNHFAVCPFHDDHNPSMAISREKQIYTCFVCNSSGNVFTFVMNYENVSFPDAVRIVAAKVGISLKSKIISNEKHKNEYQIMELTSKFYLNNINTKSGSRAKKYLEKRGIDDSIINEFNIGFALDEKDSLISFFKNQGINTNDLENLGLINKNGIDIYDFFRNRIIIPIENIQGKVVGFTGRIFNNEDMAKYINSKEGVIFKKSNILFNYSNARKYIKEASKVIVVEGNMDAIKLSCSGIKNVVALMGTFITNEQLDVLRKLNTSIILMLDNDKAGFDATVKNGDILLDKGINADVVRLSDAKDPDEYINKFGIEALRNNILSPMKYLDFKIEFLKSKYNLDSSEDLASFIKEIISSIRSLDDFTKSIILDKISKDYNINIDILLKIGNTNKSNPKERVVKNATTKKSKYRLLSNAIIYYLALDKRFIKIYKNDLNFLKEKLERTLVGEIDSFYKSDSNLEFADLITYISNKEELYDRLSEVIKDYNNEVLDEKVFIGYLKTMNSFLKDDEIKELKKEIALCMDIDKKIKLIERLTKIKKGSVDYE